MRKFKSAAAVLLCLIILLSFAACGKKGDDATDESGKQVVLPDEQTQTLEQAGISLDEILKANDIASLMKKYETVTVKTQSSDGSETVKQVFRFEDGIALVSLKKDANGAELVTGEIKGFDFITENDRVKAYRDVEKLNEKAEFGHNDLLTDLFEDKELVSAGGSEDYYILKSLSEDKKTGAERYFYIVRSTLELEKVTFKNAVGNTETVTVTHNSELEDFAKKITEGFEGEMKTVKIVGKFSDGDEVSDMTVKLELPADWEYVPSGDGRIDYYMDKAMTQGYAYPGHGKNYTLYISDIFDDEDTGKK